MIRITLKETLRRKNKSVYWLQKKTGVTYAILLRLNKGEGTGITFDVLGRICKALDCSTGDLLKAD